MSIYGAPPTAELCQILGLKVDSCLQKAKNLIDSSKMCPCFLFPILVKHY